jgi:hypothetical protein
MVPMLRSNTKPQFSEPPTGDRHDAAHHSANRYHCEHSKFYKYTLLPKLQKSSGTPMNTILQSSGFRFMQHDSNYTTLYNT